MKYIADLHIHSHFSRATSKASNLLGLAAWAAIKGIQVVGTGDFTHPGWFAHLLEHLEPAEPGFFRLKQESAVLATEFFPDDLYPSTQVAAIRFVLSAEISSIYKRGGKVRKVHNLLYVPDFDAARNMNGTLATLGNIESDGRPILGLDSHDLLEIFLEKAPEGFFVPAHIWTPWFSLFGSKSGFDSIEECFGDLSPHIFALETGLSSDPEMNRLVSALDRYTLISNSDCHSPHKLGREANIFTTAFDFHSLREALRSPVNSAGEQVFAGTIEFYPEEGKYHCDGHRKCGVCLTPEETRQVDGVCPQCGKPLTIGVLYRVMELADRETPLFLPQAPAVHSLIPLPEIIAELLACGPTTKKVQAGYARLISTFGSEFSLLLQTPLADIQAAGFPLVAEAISRIRENKVIRTAGYDGEFGVIKVFSQGEQAALCGQGTLFDTLGAKKKKAGKIRKKTVPSEQDFSSPQPQTTATLNPEQNQAVETIARLVLVQAGPGTGKTHTLVARVKRLLEQDSTTPCTVITFTNKAATELTQRLHRKSETKYPQAILQVATFHGYCLQQLRRFTPELKVVGPEERLQLLEELFADRSDGQRKALADAFSHRLAQPEEALVEEEWRRYQNRLREQQLIDIEAVVPALVALLDAGERNAELVRTATGHLFVDEFQDVNQAQFNLVSRLATTSSIFAIGDPDQSIYGFRGADPRWFSQFITNFQPEFHQLVRNYRSGSQIVEAARLLIAHNPHQQQPAVMHPHSEIEGRLYVKQCRTPREEALFIADQIELQVGGTSHQNMERFDVTNEASVSFADIGVLFRTGRQAEILAEILATRAIPFQLVDVEAFYIREPSCRMLYLWLLLLADLAEVEDILLLLVGEKGIGRRSVALIRTALRLMEQPRLELVGTLAGRAGTALKALQQDIVCFREAAQHKSLIEVLLLLSARYHVSEELPEIKRLLLLAQGFAGKLEDFAQYLHDFSDSIVYDPRSEAVTLCTLHAAKGLEFPVVFMPGLEEDLIPLAPRQPLPAALLQAQVEEERRLMYVGITRAISSLYLCWSQRRRGYRHGDEPRERSRFLAEIPQAFLQAPPIIQALSKKKASPFRQLSLFP